MGEASNVPKLVDFEGRFFIIIIIYLISIKTVIQLFKKMYYVPI